MTPERITIPKLPEYTGLDETSAEHYFKAKYSALPLLKNQMLSPFEELLKQHTGYTQDRLPEQKKSTTLSLGEITFTVDSECRVKRPAWASVYDGIRQYLQFRIDQKESRKQTVEIPLSEAFHKVLTLRQEVLEDEIKQTINHSYSGKLEENLVVPLSIPLTLTAGDALLYVQAEQLSEYLRSKVVAPFETALKESAGYTEHNPPAEMMIKWVQIGKHLAQIKTIPEQTVRYASIMDDVLKEAPAKVTAASKIGEWVCLRDDLPLSATMKKIYHPRKTSRGVVVSIPGMLRRLEQLKEEHTHPTINQPLQYYPVI